MREQKEHLSNISAQFLGWGLLITSFCWAFWPILSGIVETWATNSDYSHGFFIIPLVTYLIWRKGGWEKVKNTDNWQMGFVVVVLGVLAALVGMFSQFRTLGNLSLLLVIWGVFLFLYGFRIFLMYGWELFLFVFLLPIPSRIYASLTLPLQLIVTKVSFFFLQLFHIPVYREGNVLYLANVSLEVVNACSGLRSIITIIMLAYVIACISLEKISHKLFLVLFSILIAMLSNIIRVLILAVFAQHGYNNFIDGIGHTILGLVLFLMSFYLLILISRVLTWMSFEKI